jgi:hypothetical protein
MLQSWETTLIGVGGMLICGLCIWLGLLYDNDQVLGLGLALLPVLLGALGLTARSERQHIRDKTNGES